MCRQGRFIASSSWTGPAPPVCLTALLVAAAAAGCSDGSHEDGKPGERDRADPAATRVQGRCRVTRNNHSVPPGEKPPPGSGAPYLGNGELWTSLWPGGVVVARPADVTRNGSIAMKFPWWRGVRGKLKITGRRLDARSPGLRAHILSGYGPIGFQSTALTFPAKGCWEVTGRVGDARLTFVTLVRVKRSRRPMTTNEPGPPSDLERGRMRPPEHPESPV